jgi:dihydrofolate synthase / folylpolyglutamate synthase
VTPTLSEFLNAKPLYYDEIDYDRMPRIYTAIREQIRVSKVIHMVGTNGKGTTGRFIANALYRAGFKTGHYTSPHILRFNERIWIDGTDAGDVQLETAHKRLYTMLGGEAAGALSYFEYTTLLAMLCFEGCDWVVLEAGLGGEHDATNVFDKTLSVFTPIDIDHQAFLGETIDAIAATKLRSMGPVALLGKQPHPEVEAVYDTIGNARNARCLQVQEILRDADMALAETIARRHRMPDYLGENLLLAMAALRLLGCEPEAGWFEPAPLFGRLTRVAPNVMVDVGHNLLAAKAICRAIAPDRVVLVYNSFKDKDYKAILRALRPIVKRVEIIDVEEGRIAERARLESVLEAEEIPYTPFHTLDPEEEYLVFGSFSVVEAFMREQYA